jgi:hypothetical protein
MGAAALLALAPPADARKFQMSGTWLMRKGQSFIPLQFGSPSMHGVNVSMGLLTELMPVDPEQVVSAVGGASAAGSGPAKIGVPKQFWDRSHGVVLPLFGTMLVQITTMIAIDAPFATAILQADGGPGNFTWCPQNPACAAGGPVPGPGLTRGRIVYVAGPNRFGGTMQMGLSGRGFVSLKGGGLPPGAAGHLPFAVSGPALRRLAVGGGANDVPSIDFVKLAPAVLTAPIGGIPASGMLITMPGPIVGTLPLVDTPMGAMTGQFTTNWGFPHTTGTILVQQDGYFPDSFFTLMGSDARTPLGAGNLSTVAGGLARRNTLSGDTLYGQFDRVSMTFGPPVPSLSPDGFAVAGLLLLLAAGYALRRRIL